MPVAIDVARLRADYDSIPAAAWSASYWDEHGSADMLLLRGGGDGTEDDFTTSDPADQEALSRLPYLAELLGDAGPFGRTTYAYIFRMKPMGVSRVHVDAAPAWADPFRVHIPITTNDDACLLSEGRAKHLAVGEVWTFDNQLRHGAVNGDTVRSHLIIDVPPNPIFDSLLERSRWDPGEHDPQKWERTLLPDRAPTEPLVESVPLSADARRRLGVAPAGFASRIVEVLPMSRLVGARLRVGDVIWSVDGVDSSALARSATDYIQLRHRPGDVVTLGVVRNGRRFERRVRLFPPNRPWPLWAARRGRREVQWIRTRWTASREARNAADASARTTTGR